MSSKNDIDWLYSLLILEVLLYYIRGMYFIYAILYFYCILLLRKVGDIMHPRPYLLVIPDNVDTTKHKWNHIIILHKNADDLSDANFPLR